jgi:hypothetical protein
VWSSVIAVFGASIHLYRMLCSSTHVREATAVRLLKFAQALFATTYHSVSACILYTLLTVTNRYSTVAVTNTTTGLQAQSRMQQQTHRTCVTTV